MMQRKSFTLIELMVVIAIIAVLAAVVAPQVFKQVQKGRVASVESFYNSVKIAATSYFSDNGTWTPTCTPATCNTNTPGFVTGPTGTSWDGPYLDRWPIATGNPWAGAYNWDSTAATANFGAAVAAERWITIAAVPLAAAQRIDLDKDGAISGTLGMVRRFPAAAWTATNTVRMLISRDGPVT